MSAIAEFTAVLALPSWLPQAHDWPSFQQAAQQNATGIAVGVMVVGLILLLFGVKLARLLATLLFVALGAIVGSRLGASYKEQMNFAQLAWAGGVGGGIIVGLLGFLLYRLWVILAFGALLSAIAAGGYLWAIDPGQVEHLRSDLCCPATDTAAAEAAPPATEQARSCPLDPDARKLLRDHPLGVSLSALGGLVLGLLLGGFAYRLAAVLLTSLVGLAVAVAGMWHLTVAKLPELARQVESIGWKAWLGVAGLWLIGVATQITLARSRPKEEPPAEEKKEK